MQAPAYIVLDEEGYVTLYHGTGAEAYREVIVRGPQPESGEHLLAIIEDMKAWAEEQGYTVVVPSYGPEVPEINIEVTDQDAEVLNDDDVNNLLDDLFAADDGGSPFDDID